MDIARRKFIKAGAVAALLGAALPFTEGAVALGSPSNTQPARGTADGLQATAANHPDLLAYYGKSAFNAYLNTSFRLSLGASLIGKLSLERVIEMTPLARQKMAAAEGKECFALRFRGSRNTALRQETYTFEHEALGTFALLLVPAGADKSGSYYEANINRLES